MIQVNRHALSDALDAAVQVTKQKSSLPVLKNVFIVSHGTSLVISATNIESSLIRRMECEGDQFSTLAPCAELAKVVGSIEGDTVQLRFDEAKQTLALGSGKSKYTFRCLSPDEFPTLPRVAGDSGGRTFTVEPGKLAEAIERTRTFVDSESIAQYAFSGLEFRATESEITVSGASTPQVSIYSFDSKQKASAPVVVSAESAAMALSILRAPGSGGVSLSFSDRHWSVKCDHAELIGRLIEGGFPDMSKLIPDGPKATATVNRIELIAAVNRLASLRGDTLAIRLEPVKEGMQLTYGNQDVGSGVEIVAAEMVGKFESISFKSYLISNVAGVARSERLAIGFPDGGKMALFSEPEAAEGYSWRGVVAALGGR